MKEHILFLLAGLGAFLIGFKILSENIEKLANNGLRKLFNKISQNKLAGVGIGAVVTALIQSSGATTVMLVGFVNAGMITLSQAVPIIMGANIGTTITAHIVALESLNVPIYAMLLSVIGVFTNMLGKKEKTKTFGLAMAGMGLVFLGLATMSFHMKDISNQGWVQDALSMIKNPALLFILGAILTIIMQSSTAVNTILIIMSTGSIVIGNGGNSIFFIILGTNVGTCFTALLSSMGTSTNAKRTAIIHLLFNAIGSLLFMLLLIIWKDCYKLFAGLKAPQQIAVFHTVFNLICTAVFLPSSNVFVKMSKFFIKDKKEEEKVTITHLDDRMLKTPALALEQLNKESITLANNCMQALRDAYGYFKEGDTSGKVKIDELNANINVYSKQITDYLIKVSSNNLSIQDEKTVSRLHHSLADILRIGEVADNICKYTITSVEQGLVFSVEVRKQIDDMFENIEREYKEAVTVMTNRDMGAMNRLGYLEDEIDDMRTALIDGHIERLNKGECNPSSSAVFINLISNLERVGDHISFIAQAMFE